MLLNIHVAVCRRKPSISMALLLVASFGLLLTAAITDRQTAGSSLDGVRAQSPANLQQVLEFGLKARRPGEFRFIARVVQMVDRNQLPRDIVEGTFHWARRQHKRPFPYFERGLRIRAERIGVQI